MSEQQAEIQVVPDVIADLTVGGVSVGVALGVVGAVLVQVARKWQKHRRWLRRLPFVSRLFVGDWDELYFDPLTDWILSVSELLADPDSSDNSIFETAFVLSDPTNLVESVDGELNRDAPVVRRAKTLQDLVGVSAEELAKTHPRSSREGIEAVLNDPLSAATLIKAKPQEVDETLYQLQLEKQEKLLQKLRKS